MDPTAKAVQKGEAEITEGLKLDLATQLRESLSHEFGGRCPIPQEECYRLIGRYLGDPKMDKSTEKKLEAIPKFSGSGKDSIAIMEFLERISTVSKNEPNLTRIYYLKLRLDGFLRTNVEEMERLGKSFTEIITSLKQDYSR